MSQPDVQWTTDAALADFEATTLHFPPDYDGPVVATLVRRQAANATSQAVLYLHGYMDYFFQRHLAEHYNQHGFNFYALDLRKYGRSLRPGQHPNFCKDLREYFAEITTALRIVAAAGNTSIVLNGHSTGGLTAALYAAQGVERGRIKALVLNSPFFAFNLRGRYAMAVTAAARLAPLRPFGAFSGSAPIPYIESIHADHHGEWDFDLRWRPLVGFPNYAGWLRAILRAHETVRRGLNLACPILVMHASRSVYGRRWKPDFQRGDGVLNVEHIREGSRHLGSQVNVVAINDGLHDLVLSRPDVREQVFAEMFGWLSHHMPTTIETHAERISQ